MANNVILGNYNVYDDFDMELVQYEPTYPEPERLVVDVPGRDGAIDITNVVFGKIPYKNRKITILLQALRADVNRTFAEQESYILNAVHGKSMNIIFEDDPGWYYTGVVLCSALQEEEEVWSMTIEIDADPYKYLISDPTQKSL